MNQQKIAASEKTGGEVVDASRNTTKNVEKVVEQVPDNKATQGSGYSHLKEPNTVGPGLKTTPAQRKRILEENRRRNGGVLRSDQSGVELTQPGRLNKGDKRPLNEAQIDHIEPRSGGGSNSNSNQQVLSFEENLRKSDN